MSQKPKTPAEIAAEVAKLKAVKPKVRRTNHFGEDNWAKIDAEIAVLEGRMSEDAIWRAYGPPVDGDGQLDGEPDAVCDAALSARRWMDGDGDEESIADGWQGVT